MPGTEDNPVLPPDEPHQGPAGPRGMTGMTGLTGRGITRREKLFAVTLLLLVLVMGAGSLLSGYVQNNRWQQKFTQSQQQQAVAQQKAGAAITAQLCAIFEPIATLKAPAGDASNPSRIFEQKLEANLARVAPVLKCKK